MEWYIIFYLLKEGIYVIKLTFKHIKTYLSRANYQQPSQLASFYHNPLLMIKTPKQNESTKNGLKYGFNHLIILKPGEGLHLDGFNIPEKHENCTLLLQMLLTSIIVTVII